MYKVYLLSGNHRNSSLSAGALLPQKWFRYDRFPWRMWKLERGGAIYRKIRIHKWKETFPDMSRIPADVSVHGKGEI